MIPIENIYYLLCYAWNNLEEKDKVHVDDISGSKNLINLLAKVLCSSSRILLKKGIDRNYINHTDSINTIKGKLELSSTLKKQLHIRQRAICTYSELSSDILHNRILITTLKNLLLSKSLDIKIAQEVKNIIWMFDKISLINLTPAVFHQVRLNRNNKIYKFIVNICELIYKNSLPSEAAGKWKFIDFTRNERQMNKLFEAFIRNFYKREQRIFNIVKKEQIKWKLVPADDLSSKYLPIMETDITLANSTSKIIMDAKYYSETMTNRYDIEKIKSNNLYQLFSYLSNQEDGSLRNCSASGVLIYPTINQEYNLKYNYKNHTLHIKTLNLNTHWSNIHSRLIEILNDVNRI